MTNRRPALISSPSARQAIAALADEFEEFDERVTSKDPLGWPDYQSKLRRATAISNESEAVVTGVIRLAGVSAVVAGMDFRFMGGSMGTATGTRIVRAIREARRRRWAFVSLIASGGARIQEGMCALTQMQRIATAHAEARADGIPHIAVLRHPTTGGLWAALGSVADIIFALEGGTVAFAGPRVRGDSTAPGPEFTSTGQHRHGAVDQVVADHQGREKVALAVELLGPATRGPMRRADLPLPLAEATRGSLDRVRSAWEQVLAARRPTRPRAGAYLEAYFETRLEISGDRAGGRDPGMLCGFGRRSGRTIAYVAQSGGRNTAAGFRTAKRLLELASRLQLPILTLVDTPGAANDAAAERGAVGTAIGELFQAVATSPVPITSLVIGEGGSGGALALAAPEDLWIVPDGYFAVIAPEGAAAILKRDRGRAAEIAERMRLTPPELLQLGVVRGILGQPRNASSSGTPA
jgi:acetyl-CoA carboxylase beta subunit/acetyl-CoA carboxylase alpha subunit